MILQNNNTLVTHNGSFHSDDIFSCAVLCLLLEKKKESFQIIRTRDEEIIKNGTYVFDVGGIYDEKINRFDHHQIGGAGRRDNGIEYASFGLVWKKFGIELTGSREQTEWIDKHLVAPIDAHDNGMSLVESKSEISPYLIQDFFGAMRPTWREKDLSNDDMFLKSVTIAKEILLREITQAKDALEAKDIVTSIYNKTIDKRIIILNEHYPYENVLYDFAEPLFVIYPRETDSYWCVKAVRKNPTNFENKKNLPVSWGGLRDEELQKVTGVDDAVFCHRALFLAVAKTKEGAIKLAEKALLE